MLKKRITAEVKGGVKAPKNVLVLGCSNGYGFACRITAAFAYGAGTIGVSFEKVEHKQSTATRSGTTT